jgi:methylenetetrahydrofolate--tRNA-(uracil-5-)-methyltransferase
MEIIGGELIEIAKSCQVPAGNALAIDRHAFSQRVTEKIEQNPDLNLIREEVV